MENTVKMDMTDPNLKNHPEWVSEVLNRQNLENQSQAHRPLRSDAFLLSNKYSLKLDEII